MTAQNVKKVKKLEKMFFLQNDTFFLAKLAFYHIVPSNIDVLRGPLDFYQILRRQPHIPSRPEQKQSIINQV